MGLTTIQRWPAGRRGVAEAPEAAVPDRLGDEADEADEDAEAISPEAAAADTEAQAWDLFAPDWRELTDPGPAIALADPQQPSVTSRSEIHPATVVEPAPAVVEPAPAVVEPAPAVVEPAPAVVEPAPGAGNKVSMRCLTAGRPVSLRRLRQRSRTIPTVRPMRTPGWHRRRMWQARACPQRRPWLPLIVS